ncbi:MAG: hypothetical protein Tsb0020_51020 [Haliangiales bacterium]
MGLLDKIKSAKNFVTGGGAEVAVDVEPARRGEPCRVSVRATVSDAALSVARVYVIVRGEEHIDLLHRDYEDGHSDTDRVRKNEESFRVEIDVATPGELEAQSSHEWSGEFTLPSDAQPSYHGRYARHIWRVQAGLDVRGNDPDSGWVEFYVS